MKLGKQPFVVNKKISKDMHYKNTQRNVYGGARLQSQCSGGRDKGIFCEFEASMLYKVSPGQPGICYTEKPCLNKQPKYTKFGAKELSK